MTLGVGGNFVTRRQDSWYTNHSFGRVVTELATRVAEVRCFCFQAPPQSVPHCDYRLAESNVSVHVGPMWATTLQALSRPGSLFSHYRQLARSCDALFLRGSLPALWVVHFTRWARTKPVVHWVVGDPVALMLGEDRGYGSALTWLGVLYARLDRLLTRVGIRISKAHVVANGAELARIFASSRTHEVVSSTISDEDFTERPDTCGGPTIRILFVGIVRPEKGIEHLVRALPLLKVDRPVELSLIGSWTQFPHERQRLLRIIDELGAADRVRWEGYASFGSELFGQLDRGDLLVLPSLSEGTPRVLVEARARGVPVVATRVGGIPSSVHHEEDGLLVPPRDPEAIASAVTRIIRDGALRRRLIMLGRERMRELTLSRFVDLILELLTTK